MWEQREIIYANAMMSSQLTVTWRPKSPPWSNRDHQTDYLSFSHSSKEERIEAIWTANIFGLEDDFEFYIEGKSDKEVIDYIVIEIYAKAK